MKYEVQLIKNQIYIYSTYMKYEVQLIKNQIYNYYIYYIIYST